MASQVYPVAELMTQVLGFASLHTIISVGHANMQGRDYMRATLASFVKDMLEPYLPEPGKLPYTLLLSVLASYH